MKKLTIEKYKNNKCKKIILKERYYFMKLHFFRIPIHDLEREDAELNRFLDNNRIVAVI